VILAAGRSSRLGTAKQLLLYNGKTLLAHAVEEAINTEADAVVIVLGANAKACLNEINTAHTVVIENTEWENGMASSLVAGIKTLLQQLKTLDGIIVMVCDQPFVSTSVLNDLVRQHQDTGKPVVVSNYGEAIGPPAFFHRSFFDELMQLKGDEGARKIIQKHKDQVATVLFPLGKIDIDSIEDYEKLNN
jgi:molybdenum cofactor cytidylyltransferase